MEPESFPEHEVALAVDLHLTVRRAECQRVVEMPSGALDEARGDRHLPPSAALPQVGQRGAFRRLAAGAEVRAEAIAGVEELGQDHQFGPRRRARSGSAHRLAAGWSAGRGCRRASGSRQPGSSCEFTSASLRMANRGHQRAPIAMDPMLGSVPSDRARTARLLNLGLDRRSVLLRSIHRLGCLDLIGFFPRRELGIDREISVPANHRYPLACPRSDQ